MGIEILGSEDDVIFITNSEPDEGEDQTDHVSETSDEDKWQRRTKGRRVV